MILLAGRMAVPQELYEAAAVDGANGLRRFAHVTLPLMANLYLVCVLLDMVFALGDFNSTFFVSGGGPGDVHRGARHARHPLCLYRMRSPVSAWRTVMSALPVLIPLVIILMRKLRMSEGQL